MYTENRLKELHRLLKLVGSLGAVDIADVMSGVCGDGCELEFVRSAHTQYCEGAAFRISDKYPRIHTRILWLFDTVGFMLIARSAFS